MYKNAAFEIKEIPLDTALYRLHKTGEYKSDFGMDNTASLLDGGFALYSTVNLKKKIGPIKTQYFRIALTRKGYADFGIGLEKYQPRRDWILFGVPGQVFSLYDASDDFFAYYMLFSEKFISGAFSQSRWSHFPFLTYAGIQCFPLHSDTATEAENIILKMNDEIKARKADCSEAIKLFIRLIIIYANRDYSTMVFSQGAKQIGTQNLFNSYVKLVSQHFLTVRKVADYAHMLHVSPDHLNRTIKSYSDKTAHELIDEMIVMEAKAYLLHSSLSIAEIAYKLEFADPSHFNRFFKKSNGCTPLGFRTQSE